MPTRLACLDPGWTAIPTLLTPCKAFQLFPRSITCLIKMSVSWRRSKLSDAWGRTYLGRCQICTCLSSCTVPLDMVTWGILIDVSECIKAFTSILEGHLPMSSKLDRGIPKPNSTASALWLMSTYHSRLLPVACLNPFRCCKWHAVLCAVLLGMLCCWPCCAAGHAVLLGLLCCWACCAAGHAVLLGTMCCVLQG